MMVGVGGWDGLVRSYHQMGTLSWRWLYICTIALVLPGSGLRCALIVVASIRVRIIRLIHYWMSAWIWIITRLHSIFLYHYICAYECMSEEIIILPLMHSYHFLLFWLIFNFAIIKHLHNHEQLNIFRFMLLNLRYYLSFI